MGLSCLLYFENSSPDIHHFIWEQKEKVFKILVHVTENETKLQSVDLTIVLFCLFDLILYVPSTIFQLYRDGYAWVEPVLS